MNRIIASLPLLLVGLFASSGDADVPALLTDAIYRGEGVIDLLKDVSPTDLGSFFGSNSQLQLGIDINENASGNETSNSIGVAIEQLTLNITTTSGDFTFSNFSTNTVASVVAEGAAEPEDYFVLFGQSGSSSLTGSTDAYNLAEFDDVININDISIDGAILSATLNMSLVDTSGKTVGNAAENEAFFDFSGGFEDLAILSSEDALALESANIGIAAAPTGLTFTTTNPQEQLPGDTPAGAAPPIILTVAIAGIALASRRRIKGRR